MRRCAGILPVGALLVAACSDLQQGVVEPLLPQLSSSAADSTGPAGPPPFFIMSTIALRQGDGFRVDFVSAECAAQGNTFSITSPVTATLTTDGCRLGSGSWTYDGPYPDGTTVTFSFWSGYTGSPGAIRVTGSHPTWLVECEDGFDNDFNDVVFRVTAVTAACSTGDGLLDDPGVRLQLQEQINLSGAFDNAPEDRRERGGYMYRAADGSVALRARDDPDATPCSMSPGGPQPQPGEEVIGVWHTHPFRHRESLPANCGRTAGAVYDNRSRGGGSAADWELIQTPYQGQHLPMYVIDREQVFRLDAATPPRQRSRNPNRWDWNTQRCTW
jgi:hypothetical protein